MEGDWGAGGELARTKSTLGWGVLLEAHLPSGGMEIFHHSQSSLSPDQNKMILFNE